MSVYIGGMEMPKSRGEYGLILYVDSDGTATVEGSYCRFEGEPFDAVPVPPHGDLMDRDGIKWIEEEFEERCHNDRWTVVEKIAYKAQVDKLPTIIPAEPPKEES